MDKGSDRSATGARQGAVMTFLWEHLGPPHHDRLRAVHAAGHPVLAVELFGKSADYRWHAEGVPPDYAVATLASERTACGPLRLAWRIVRAIRAAGARKAFLCHYNEIAVFLAAIALRLAGVRVVTMIDSKADDRTRSRFSAIARRIILLPYHGALVAGPRSADYVAGLGIPAWRMAMHYNTLNIAALKALGEGGSVATFAERPFLVVGRLIPEKNLGAALHAFAHYRSAGGGGRRLVIAGEGPEQAPLLALADSLGIAEFVDWPGIRSRAEIARMMRGALALLLPSTSETYGFVVIEALAHGLVPIVSARAGAVDLLLDDQLNGFVVEPDAIGDIAGAMVTLDRDEARWRMMSAAAQLSAERADVRHFVASVELLAER